MPQMPDPPQTSVFTRWILENPWPVAILLAALAIVMAWTALRDGRMARLKIAIAPAVASLLVMAAGIFITTAGERGEAVVEDFVEAVVNEDVLGAPAMLSDDATMALGKTTNPGFDAEYVKRQLDQLMVRYDITSNRITRLRGYGLSADRAEVHLGCRTEVNEGWGPTPSQWVIEVKRQDDGQWKISRVTNISVGVQSGNAQWLR